MAGDIPMIVVFTDCKCEHGEHGRHTICGGCMRRSQEEAKRRKRNGGKN